MAPRHRLGSLILLAIFLAPLLAGCLEGADDRDAPVLRPGWAVGDRWVYLRTTPEASGIYAREVTGIFEKRGQEVFEVTEGLVGHPIRQYSLYTIDLLRFMGMEVRDGHDLRTRTDPEEPLTFHYVFPLQADRSIEESGRIRQSAGGVRQVDPVEITAKVSAPIDLTLDERIYRVWPYEVNIRYTATPLDDEAVIRGHWSPDVGQSVLTTIEEGGATFVYELLSFERAVPLEGAPVYRLTGELESSELLRSFKSTSEGAAYRRHLFHVTQPTEIEVRFSLAARETRDGLDRVDLVALRPLGYARAGVAWNATAIADPGVVMHLAASRANAEPVVFHTPEDQGLEKVRLLPGQVYELLLASNVGPVSAEVVLGTETQRLRPVETGGVDILAVSHKRHRETLDPGPHNIRDSVEALIAVPEKARVEGVVYAINHGGQDEAVGEIGAEREVSYRVDGFEFRDPVALYGFYLGHMPHDTFRVEGAFHYRAEMALQGVVDYEVGALLVRLVPPERGD